MNGHRARLTLDLPQELHRDLKIRSAQSGLTMRAYCERALRKVLSDEPRALTAAEAPELAELWDNEDDAIYDKL